ncbi:hypothetical protein [Ralstonia pickettii]|uniref:hypothetical protein n=1 Tax=Ralstonia pickettii TaxID=329 RepID=UPI00046AB70B|nr:hypothetical protein [Ralstonia pickettii]
MAEEHADLVRSVVLRVGRNILMFQQVESTLKFLLPFMHPNGSARGDAAFASFRQKVKGQTLGKLAEAFLESVKADTDTLEQDVKRMVEQRNQLVHHFNEMPGVSLLTEAGCRTAIQVLDDQHEETVPLQTMVQGLAATALSILAKEHFAEDADLATLIATLKEYIPVNFEYIDLDDPRETDWGSTRIVQALRLAEAQTEPVNGMTSLASAGRYLRSLDADLVPQTYGVSRLKRILQLSGVFEVVDHRPHEAAEPVTLYRSKPRSGPSAP